MMWTLMKKDWRMLRTGTIGAVAVTVLLYGIAGLSLAESDRTVRTIDVMDGFASAAIVGIVISAIISAMYGSGAFALERHDRSADFLAMMPVSRWRILVSKAIVTIGCSLFFLAIHFSMLIIFGLRSERTRINDEDFRRFVVILLGINLLFFCTAWFFSTFLPSAVISIAVAIIFCAAMLTILGAWTHHRSDELDDRRVGHLMDCWTYGVGLACLVAAVIYYPRRIAP